MRYKSNEKNENKSKSPGPLLAKLFFVSNIFLLDFQTYTKCIGLNVLLNITTFINYNRFSNLNI